MGISERRLNGWAPTETHEHYDADGNLTGVTVVTREAEWDDFEQAKMLALVEYERGIHNGPGECGFHDSIAKLDPEVAIEHDVCPLCASKAVEDRKQDARDDRLMKRYGDDPKPDIPRPGDGRREFLRLVSLPDQPSD